MAQKVVIDLEAKTDKAIKEIEKVSESITELNQEVVKGNKNTSKSLDGVEKSASSVSKGIKGFGLALKAAGIGLVISALTSMKEIFSQNQRVVDVFSTGFEAFSIVVNQVVNALINTYDAIAKSSENFNGLSKVLGGLMTIGITPLKLGFFAIKLGIQQAQLAWEESFFGGKDNDKIKELITSNILSREQFIDIYSNSLTQVYKNYNGDFKSLVAQPSIQQNGILDINELLPRLAAVEFLYYASNEEWSSLIAIGRNKQYIMLDKEANFEQIRDLLNSKFLINVPVTTSKASVQDSLTKVEYKG